MALIDCTSGLYSHNPLQAVNYTLFHDLGGINQLVDINVDLSTKR